MKVNVNRLPTVAIIVPIYHVEEKLVVDCIESIVSQTYKNMEIILIDDGNAGEYATFIESMGFRFHGNVVALWNKIPALFFVIDSRTEELIRYFDLPFIKSQDFDDEKPIEYYYKLADYEKFNKTYKKKYFKYKDFLRKNKLISN